ncbi:MAG: exosortase E/protease, VPEID-CTERM system [Planctomycetes bacterium]|nr:exosortase E/protease, VPEID-CTERM system [Planctomycetota bacterium]
MNSNAAQSPSAGSKRPFVVVWSASLAAQTLALGVRFDSAALERCGSGWWSPWVAASGFVMPLAASLAAALVLVAFVATGAQPRAAPAWSPGPPPSPGPARGVHRRSAAVALELASFTALIVIGETLFDAAKPLNRPGLWMASALASAALMLGAWCAALAPWRAWRDAVLRRPASFVGAATLGLLAFVVGHASQDLWTPLRRATLGAAHALLARFEPSAFADSEQLVLGARDFAVRVAPECSGYEGLGLAVVFVLGSFVLCRDVWRFSRAWLVLPLAALAAWCANAVRLAALVALGARVSPTLALGGFHSYAGTLLFSVAVLGTITLALRSPFFARIPARAEPNPAAPYLVPWITVLFATWVSRAFAAEAHEPLYFVRPLVGCAALVWFLPRYRGEFVRPSGLALGAGAAVAVVWLAIALREPGVVTSTGDVELALRALHAVAVTPVVEELAFRGFLARRVVARDFAAVAPTGLGLVPLGVSAVAFGALHERAFAGVLAGFVFALVYRRRGALADCVWAHAFANGLLVVVGLALGRAELWK